MKFNLLEKNKGCIILGLMLCFVFVAFLTITVMTVCESFSEKARLESIGATVTLKITWLFVVDIIVIIASGVFGIVFLSKNISAHNTFVEDEMIEYKEDEEIVLYDEKKASAVNEVEYDIDVTNRFKTEDIVVEIKEKFPITSTEAISKSSKLKIKMENSSFSEDTSSSEHIKSEKNVSFDNKSAELRSGFFIAGDDL